MQGEVINGFVLKRLLGEGGMAEVWYAENEIGKPAAVKILFEKLTRNAQIVERFHNEALVMVKLNHPNIRQVYSYGYLGDRHCIVMEYLEGDDLSDMMKAGRRFTDEELKRWWNQIVSALSYTHAQGIVHRDLKPSNLFLDQDGNIKLLDFGIAKMMENSSLTQTGAQMGTLMYMSPEQVKDSKSIDYHTDIYSLAVTFVHLLTGKKPYDVDTTSDFEIREKIVYTPYDVSALPEEWQGFLAPYLEKEPQNRPELRKFEATPLVKPAVEPQPAAESTQINAPKTPVLQEAPKRKSKAGLFIGLGIGVAVLLAAVVAVVFLMKPNPDNEAFDACASISDYRAYMNEYGSNGLHYKEAKAIVDKHVADSTAEALAKERDRLKAEVEKEKKEAEKAAAAKKEAEKAAAAKKEAERAAAAKAEAEKAAAAKKAAEKAAAEKKKAQQKQGTKTNKNGNTNVKQEKTKTKTIKKIKPVKKKN